MKAVSEDLIGRAKEMFTPESFSVPKTASSSVLVEGVPSDATERELAHIFRPFQGYIAVRIVPVDRAVESDNSRVDGPICSVDFENNVQATAVINTL